MFHLIIFTFISDKRDRSYFIFVYFFTYCMCFESPSLKMSDYTITNMSMGKGIYLFADYISLHELTHSSQTTPYGDMDLSQYWVMQCLGAWWHQRWFLISRFLCVKYCTTNADGSNHYNALDKCTFKIKTISPGNNEFKVENHWLTWPPSYSLAFKPMVLEFDQQLIYT